MNLKFVIGIFSTIHIIYAFTVPREFKLDIVHYNDFHARNHKISSALPFLRPKMECLYASKITGCLTALPEDSSANPAIWRQVSGFEETSVATPTCRYNNNSCLGGFPRLYHEIQVLLKEKPDAILLNAGDSFQGTFWYTLLKWNVTQEFMNLLPHDAHAIGNHEFDDGPAGLAPYLSALKAPVLAANMDASQEPSLQGLYRPSTVVTRKGKKIGLIGLITPDTAILSTPGKVKFTDPGEALAREAKALDNEGVEIIVVLSHCGLETDKKLAREYGKYVDIIIGGHSHSLLWNGPAPSGETVVGPYPVFVESSSDKNHEVLIVQASAFTKYMSNLSVYFDFRGNYVKWEGGPIFLNRTISEDETIKAKLAPYAKMVHEAENRPIGETENNMNFEDCVFGECSLGNLLVDSLRDHAESVLNVSHVMSFIQRGNIKASLLKGVVTVGNLFELFPYNDRIETFDLQGQHIIEALERGVSDAWAYDPFKGPWVLQVSGIRVAYNVSRPEGQRVTSVMVADQSKPLGDLNPDMMYKVVMPIYLADGGDGFTMFKDNRVNRRTIGRDQLVLENYIRNHSPLNITVEGRIVIRS